MIDHGRYGALRARLDTMQMRISAYLDESNTSVTRVEELEVQTYPIWSDSGPSLMLSVSSFYLFRLRADEITFRDWGRAARATPY